MSLTNGNAGRRLDDGAAGFDMLKTKSSPATPTVSNQTQTGPFYAQ